MRHNPADGYRHGEPIPDIYVAGRTSDGYTLIAANPVAASKILDEYEQL